MNRVAKVLSLLILASILPAAQANAVVSIFDDHLIYGHSWSQEMIQSAGGLYDYDFIRTDWIAGPQFSPHGGVTEVDPSWTDAYDTPTSNIMTRVGNQSDDLNFTWCWEQPRTYLILHVAIYGKGNAWEESGIYTLYGAGGQNWRPDDWKPGTDVPPGVGIPEVPEPTSLLLLIGGVASFVWLKRRRS